MSEEGLWRLGGTVLTVAALALVPWLLTGVQGQAELPVDWLARVHAGESLHQTDLGIGLHIGVRDGVLQFREAPRWLPMVLSVPALGVLAGLTALLWWSAGDHDGWTWAGLLAAGVGCVGLAALLGGVVTHGVTRSVQPDALEVAHTAYFGLVQWEERHALSGPAQWNVAEECSDVDGEEVCFGWVNVEFLTDRGFVRVARLPHSLGARADYDAAQEASASALVVGIEAHRRGELP